jgi:hypothetical protein
MKAAPFTPDRRNAVMEAVQHQLCKDDPPETRETLERLISTGRAPDGANRLIARALLTEMTDMLHERRAYNPAKYAAMFAPLPSLPSE